MQHISHSKKLRWGIIGCGDVCEVKSGPAFNKVPDSTLIAVMRRDRYKAEDYARRHGVPKFHDQAQALIDDPDVDAVYIATPPANHEEYALQCIAAGKPVYIEKPLSIDAPSTRRILIAAEQAGVKATGAYYRRRLPLFMTLKQIIEAGVVGQVWHISSSLLIPAENNTIAQTATNWRIDPRVSGGGLFHDLAPHMLDILYWIFGAPLACRGWSLNQENSYQAPDFTALNAVFPGKIHYEGAWSFHVNERSTQDECVIHGSRGKLRFSFFQLKPLKLDTDLRQESLHFQNPENIQFNMISDVVRYFRGDAANPCSLAEALVSMEMMDSVTQA